MSALKTRTAQTAFGEVEYETVECASCGTEVRKDDSRRFVVGELQDRRNWHAIGEDRFSFQSETVQIGWACEFCREEGVFGFPESKIWDFIRASPEAIMVAIFVANILVSTVAVMMFAFLG